MDIEKIFQEEINTYNDNYSNLSSLVLEFGDLYAEYLDLKKQFKNLLVPSNFNQHDLSVLLQKHIDLITRINDINRSIAQIFDSFYVNSKEV